MVGAVLFDLDDTLFDHRQSAAEALRRVQHSHDCFRGASFEEFERHHALLLDALHPDVVSTRLGIDEAREERFRRLFARYGVDAPAEVSAAAARQYRAAYLDARKAMVGAQALLEAVRAHVPIGVVSNNLLAEQQEKLEHCGLASFVDALIVSEQAGVSKPDPAIFKIALNALAVRPGEAVMLGDSWAADILGARAAGIRAVWFNPFRLPPLDPHLKVPEVHALEPVAMVMEVLGIGAGEFRSS